MDVQDLKLMIVDDHAGAREMIRKFLGLPGIKICECSSGEEAVRLAREFKPDWVTMDVQMPGLNGFESTKALRLEHPAARVMIVTADNLPHFQQMSREAGATGLLSKYNLMALRVMLQWELNDGNRSAFPGNNLPKAGQ